MPMQQGIEEAHVEIWIANGFVVIYDGTMLHSSSLHRPLNSSGTAQGDEAAAS